MKKNVLKLQVWADAVALQLPPSHPRGPAMVNPTLFFSIEKDSEPLGPVSFELFIGKFPKTAENFCTLGTREERI